MPTTTSTTTSTTTPIPIIYSEPIETTEIVDEIETVEGFLLVIVIQLTLMIVYKLIKLCKRGYKMHNEKIIRIHENTNPRI